MVIKCFCDNCIKTIPGKIVWGDELKYLKSLLRALRAQNPWVGSIWVSHAAESTPRTRVCKPPKRITSSRIWLNFNGEILVKDWQDSSSKISCLKLWLLTSHFQLSCTLTILLKLVKILLILYLWGKTAGSESASMVCFYWTTFTVQAG